MTSEQLEPIIRQALDSLYENDSYLIMHQGIALPNMDSHVSERGIVFRFGIYFQRLASHHSTLQGFNIDTEYNRNLDNVKSLPNTRWAQNGALPDLIVHKRGTNENNLLVIEFKAWWSSRQLIIQDREKLSAFQCKPYNYKNTLLVLLNQGDYSLEWIGGDGL